MDFFSESEALLLEESLLDELLELSLEELLEDSREVPLADEAAPPTESCALFSSEVIVV